VPSPTGAVCSLCHLQPALSPARGIFSLLPSQSAMYTMVCMAEKAVK
jgi:hypothetical protein